MHGIFTVHGFFFAINCSPRLLLTIPKIHKNPRNRNASSVSGICCTYRSRSGQTGKHVLKGVEMYLPSDPDMLLAFFPALTDTVFIICSSGQLQFDIPEEYFSSAVHAGCRRDGIWVSYENFRASICSRGEYDGNRYRIYDAWVHQTGCFFWWDWGVQSRM